jgi:hypothetical protein
VCDGKGRDRLHQHPRLADEEEEAEHEEEVIGA